MKQQALFITAVVAAVVGLFAGKFAFDPRDPGMCEDLKSAREKLYSLSQDEYQQYLNLKDSPEKARKADQLLSQIMMLFIADLGVRLHGSKSANPSRGGSGQGQAAGGNADGPASGAVADDAGNRPAARKANTGQPQSDDRPWIKHENAVVHARTEQEAADALTNAQVPNLFPEIKNSLLPGQSDVNQLNGTFRGEVTFHDRRESWQVETVIDARVEQDKVTGKARIKISKGGQVFSDSNGEGNLEDFRLAGGGSQAILLKANGDKGYMQLYPVSSKDILVGNYYERKNVDEYLPIGNVILRKF